MVLFIAFPWPLLVSLKGLEGTLSHVSESGKADKDLSLQTGPHFLALRRSLQTSILRGHQGPWFPKFFTGQLDKGAQINKCK